MSYNVKGKIVSISENQKFDSGAEKLTFRIDTGEQYNNLLEFEMFKGSEYVEHLDKFRTYNKVGDSVDVEFNLKSFNWTDKGNDKVFISLSAWRVEKCDSVKSDNVPSMPPHEGDEEEDDLPF